jgi:hypothetical protein
MLNLAYNDDIEYRKSLNNLFLSFSTINSIPNVCEDDECYNDDIASFFLDNVFEDTLECDYFSKIYDLAAATMISTDKSVGQVVFLSYQFLLLYHKCLVNYYKNNCIFENNSDYEELEESIMKMQK